MEIIFIGLPLVGILFFCASFSYFGKYTKAKNEYLNYGGVWDKAPPYDDLIISALCIVFGAVSFCGILLFLGTL